MEQRSRNLITMQMALHPIDDINRKEKKKEMNEEDWQALMTM